MSHPCARMDIPAARPKPRPQNPSISGASRETGAFRTSVWETVLQLGLGVNPTVANWIFDNQLAEEDEVRAQFSFFFASFVSFFFAFGFLNLLLEVI